MHVHVYFVNGNPKPIGTPEEIMQNGQKMYEELSPETKEFFDFMMVVAKLQIILVAHLLCLCISVFYQLIINFILL